MGNKVNGSALAKSLLTGAGIAIVLLAVEIGLGASNNSLTEGATWLLCGANIMATGVIGAIYCILAPHDDGQDHQDALALGGGLAGLGMQGTLLLLGIAYNLVTQQLFDSTFITTVGWGLIGALHDLVFRAICMGAQLIVAFLLGMAGSTICAAISGRVHLVGR